MPTSVPWPRPCCNLADRGLLLVGLDTPSVDPADSTDLPSHQVLRQRDLRVLENLVLDAVPEGDYELIALPLKLSTADASPVRAVLRACDPLPHRHASPARRHCRRSFAHRGLPPSSMAVAACTPAAKAGRWTPTRPCGCSPALNPPTTPCWPPYGPASALGHTGTRRRTALGVPVPPPAAARNPHHGRPGARAAWCRKTARATWCMCCADRTTACSWTWPKAAAGCSATPRSTPACACSTCLPTPARFGGSAARRRGPGGQRGHGRGALATGQKPPAQWAGGAPLFWNHDIFSSWGKITRHGPYGLVIIDPPSYQKAASSPPRTTRACCAALPDLLEPGGHALLCLNAPELDSAFLRQQVRRRRPLQFVERLANPATFADAQPERALKVLLYREAG
jgi:hypothetical protein